MPQPKTPEQIAAELAKLRVIRPNLRRFSRFGDDHHGALDASIAVLQGRMSSDQIHAAYGPPAEDDDTDGAGEDFDQHILDEALQAQQWMAGEATGGDPSGPEWWGSLVLPEREQEWHALRGVSQGAERGVA